MIIEAQIHPLFARYVYYAGQFRQAQDQRPLSELAEDERATAEVMRTLLAAAPVPAIQDALSQEPAPSVARMFELYGLGLTHVAAESGEIRQELDRRERELRSTLELIESAAGV